MADPIDPSFRVSMRALASALDEVFNTPGKQPKVAFLLLTARFGEIDGGRVNFIGNTERADSQALMRELLARWEGRYSGEAGNA